MATKRKLAFPTTLPPSDDDSRSSSDDPQSRTVLPRAVRRKSKFMHTSLEDEQREERNFDWLAWSQSITDFQFRVFYRMSRKAFHRLIEVILPDYRWSTAKGVTDELFEDLTVDEKVSMTLRWMAGAPTMDIIWFHQVTEEAFVRSRKEVIETFFFCPSLQIVRPDLDDVEELDAISQGFLVGRVVPCASCYPDAWALGELGMELDARLEKLDGRYIVGDGEYDRESGVLTPIEGSELSEYELSFNYHLSLARAPVERAFGMVVRRWPILWRRLKLDDYNLICNMILTCLLLHNFIMDVDKDKAEPEREFSLDHEVCGHIYPAGRLTENDRPLENNNGAPAYNLWYVGYDHGYEDDEDPWKSEIQDRIVERLENFGLRRPLPKAIRRS
ncbi:hypothetical protein GUITHDRAFT_147326 [Guillardia theta CCMP2712]|uniref:DDE Tnp4 domain-containing protein n=1 Tax=Guillardia theta (strain CCMP2712) TaxID=905079 RepID=L1IEP4_GUITC|nr:hypothetical protein GUITHDRAFT_147326 [Guillardia theta CCMP2712]EKX34290.1 hypothetical protein GUITHDRAFT_147326 [Guillardia theta CCMP2712]|eukprot:XP_005821270.1 hypothetical protein GUITHDRAFT_147326 [Guillardia theta CCMP2712]